jgi:hypothetical protein
MLYVKSQELALRHGDGECELNQVIRDDAVVGLDVEARELRERWLHEDGIEGVAEGEDARAMYGRFEAPWRCPAQ